MYKAKCRGIEFVILKEPQHKMVVGWVGCGKKSINKKGCGWRDGEGSKKRSVFV